jgi:hypothetical protein
MDGLNDEIKDYTRMLKVGIVLTAISPILEGVTWCFTDYYWKKFGELRLWATGL